MSPYLISNKWTNHNAPYEGFCSKILTQPYLALEVIKILPLSVIQLCELYWNKPEKEDNELGYGRDSMESKYGLPDEFRHDYFPASAHQTPIFWLLQSAYWETTDFLIKFINRAVETYRHSDYGKKDVEEISLHINDKGVTQYLSWAIWGMYRGVGAPVVPYLLQSIHMALEKSLLYYSQILEPEIAENLLLQILIKSKSASLTAIVCSVVLANPDKFYNVALTLFKTIEFFHMDSYRCNKEFQAKFTYAIGYGFNKIKDSLYTDERLKTCDDKHRDSNLESLFLKYQFLGIKGFTDEQNTEFISKLYKIIDQHKSEVLINPKSDEESWDILLARMDRRNLTSRISKQDDNSLIIEFTPNLTEELKEQSKQAQNLFEETFKYSALRTWADFLIGKKNQNKNTNHEEYNNNPHLALLETKRLVEELELGRNTIRVFDNSIPAFSCSKLIIEYKDKLSKEDKDFCKKIILASVSELFSDNYDYQISDGVEASMHAIPSLIDEYPDELEDYISIMVLSLFDETKLGEYKRICDYVIESIHKSKLWEQNPAYAQAILLGYIKLKPIYKSI